MMMMRPKAYDQHMIDKLSKDKVCRDTKENREFLALMGEHRKYKKYVEETFEYYYRLFSRKQDEYNYMMMQKYHKEVLYIQGEELRLKKLQFGRRKRSKK